MATYAEPLQPRGMSSRVIAANLQIVDAGPYRRSYEWADEVDPQVGPATAREQSRSKRSAETDGWIEGTSRDWAPGEYSGNDGEADSQAIERIASSRLGRRYVEHDQDKSGGEKDLDCKCLQ